MKDFINEFYVTLETSEKKFRAVTEEESTRKPAPGKWSQKEILGHLIDSSINNIRRIVAGQLQNNLVFQGYQQNEWVRLQNYQNAEWKFLIDLWKLNNLHFIGIVKEISPEVYTKQFPEHNFDQILSEKFEKEKPVTLEDLIRDYLLHMKHHINQIVM
ncbi:MAG: DinB family protein [Ignavibacteriales bacterium]|nr:DinB family protein [Ignavibacteriales bacterium]